MEFFPNTDILSAKLINLQLPKWSIHLASINSFLFHFPLVQSIVVPFFYISITFVPISPLDNSQLAFTPPHWAQSPTVPPGWFLNKNVICQLHISTDSSCCTRGWGGEWVLEQIYVLLRVISLLVIRDRVDSHLEDVPLLYEGRHEEVNVLLLVQVGPHTVRQGSWLIMDFRYL
jgi:hypothetical protein